jgi:hypothetical protein
MTLVACEDTSDGRRQLVKIQGSAKKLTVNLNIK